MSFTPKFLSLDQIIKLHELQTEEYEGFHGIRDEGLLISALAKPEAGLGEECFHKNL